MSDEKIVDFTKAGGLTEIGGKIFKGVLERGGCGVGEKFVLNQASQAFFGREIITGNGNMVRFAVDGADDMDEFVIGDTVESEELEMKILAEF